MSIDVDVFVLEDFYENQDDPLQFGKRSKFVQVENKVFNMSWLDKLKIKPHTKAKFGILLCKMVAMPIVHRALLVDIWKMEASFQLGYKEGDKVSYVSQTNNLGKDMDVTSDSTFSKTKFHAVLRGKVVIPYLQPCLYLI